MLNPAPSSPLIFCDLTQSYSANGGGVRTFLSEKRAYIDRETPHRHLLIIPGAADRVTYEGRHITAEVKSPRVPNSPNYRLLLRNAAVRALLKEFMPAAIDCHDAYNLPWAAISHHREYNNTTLIAGYHTDFPNVYIQRLLTPIIGDWAASKLRDQGYKYAGKLYREFDRVYALNQPMSDKLRSLGVSRVDILPLGADVDVFSPRQRDTALRAKYGAKDDTPLLVYSGRIDDEKRPDIVFDAFARLPKEMNASLLMLGEGNYIEDLQKRAAGMNVHFPGFIQDRAELGRHLASADIYVTAMAFETFGISIIEAQAAGLPVVGVSSGAMIDRVPPHLGRLGPVNDADAMAANITQIWQSGEYRAMGLAAQAHVETNFSWRQTFERLFAEIYPDALAA